MEKGRRIRMSIKGREAVEEGRAGKNRDWE